jgi:hypothetical protein
MGVQLWISRACAVAGYLLCDYAGAEECVRQAKAGYYRSVPTARGEYGWVAVWVVEFEHLYGRSAFVEGWVSVVAFWYVSSSDNCDVVTN